jgi:hypothetical protein
MLLMLRKRWSRRRKSIGQSELMLEEFEVFVLVFKMFFFFVFFF